MLTSPWFDMTAIVDGRFGKVCMKAGPDEKVIGANGRIVRKSNIFTRGSGKGRDCLAEPWDLN